MAAARLEDKLLGVSVVGHRSVGKDGQRGGGKQDNRKEQHKSQSECLFHAPHAPFVVSADAAAPVILPLSTATCHFSATTDAGSDCIAEAMISPDRL